LKISLANNGGRIYDVHCTEVTAPDPALIRTITEIDLLTFSEPTFSRYTGGLMLRHGRTFLLQAEDLVIGTCQCLRSWNAPDEAVLFCMALRPGWRGQGLGRYFVAQVLEGLSASGISSVVLEVSSTDKRALHLYEEIFGFQAFAEVEDQYGRGNSKVHMRLALQEQEHDEPILNLIHNVTPLRQPAAVSGGSAPDQHCPPGNESADTDAPGATSA
jgi:ribosomal protein S18 acetylase RimI-like enzyme